MQRKDIKYYAIIIIVLIVMIIMEVTKPKELDWTVNLEKNSKLPYGSYVMYNTLEDIFPGQKISVNNLSIYEISQYKEIPENKNIIYITTKFNPDKLDTESLLLFAEAGNNIFISANSFSDDFSDTMDIATESKFLNFPDSVIHSFENIKIKTDNGYSYNRAFTTYEFSDFDTTNVTVLGERNGIINFIKIPYGHGNIFINIQPIAFTNYAMITEDNSEYVYKALSYLPVRDVIWDEYYKPNKKRDETPLRYIFQNISLKTAYFLILIALLIYMLFTAKRRQRVIPVIKPFKNTSLEFIETIGRLYYHKKNHKDIATKKYNYFLEYLRTKYYLNIKNSEEMNFEKIEEKTGASTETLKNIFKTAERIEKAAKIPIETLELFNNYIEDFYSECK